MTDRPVFRALDVCFDIDAPRRDRAYLEEVFADLRLDDESGAADVKRLEWRRRGASRWNLRFGDEVRIDRADVATVLAESFIAVNEAAAASCAPTDTVLHGGSLVFDDRAVAFVGHSGAGKSTLTAAGVIAGHGFLADEVCAVAPDGTVRPYRRPVGLRHGGLELLGVTLGKPWRRDAFTHVYPWRVGAHGTLVDSAPLGAVIFPNRQGGPPTLVPVRQADALVRLSNMTLGTMGLERLAFRRLDQLVRAVGMFELRYESAPEGIELVASELG